MFERFNTPQEAYNFKLGAALKMEQEVLEILDGAIDNAQADRVKELLETHRRETEQRSSSRCSAPSSGRSTTLPAPRSTGCVYQNLILNARAMGRDDVADLLQKNIRPEEQALEKALALQEQVAAITPQRAAT